MRPEANLRRFWSHDRPEDSPHTPGIRYPASEARAATLIQSNQEVVNLHDLLRARLLHHAAEKRSTKMRATRKSHRGFSTS